MEIKDTVTFPPQILLFLSIFLSCNKGVYSIVGLFTVLLAIVSSCSEEEFQCTSGECLPPALVCDFKTDCKNGSDEEFCGMLGLQENILYLECRICECIIS